MTAVRLYLCFKCRTSKGSRRVDCVGCSFLGCGKPQQMLIDRDAPYFGYDAL